MAIGVRDPVKTTHGLSGAVQERQDSNTNCLIITLALGIILIVVALVTTACCPSLSFTAVEGLSGCLYLGTVAVGLALIGFCIKRLADKG